MSFSLSQAVLCANCDFVSAANGEACPKCASRSLLSLASVLNRQPATISENELERIFNL